MDGFMIGQLLKGYKITEKIRDGSVGTVWKAVSPRGETVAIKRIFQKNADVPRRMKRFRKEARLTAGLAHPNIIRVIEFQDVKPLPFIVMEYFESESLKYALHQLPPRIEGHEFRILRQAAEALSYIHSRDIIHKDLKPENLLVSATSDVRLIDFSLGETKLDRWLQFRRRVEGSPLYMAPEQVQGHKCDTRSDLYSFGVVMYEVLTKKTPFSGQSMDEIFHKHVRETPAPPVDHVKGISPELNEIVLRMLAKKRENRPQDLTMVLHELAKWEKKPESMRRRQCAPCPKPTVASPGTASEAEEEKSE